MSQDHTVLPLQPELIQEPVEKKRAAGLFAYLIKAALWCLLVLAGFELLVRLTFYSMPMNWVYTNLVGEVPVPGSVLLWAKEGLGWTRYQALHEIATPYEDGAPVILLGDSHSEAWQVPEDDKFASVADTALHEAGSGYDLRNFGFSSAAMGDYVSVASLYIRTFQPRAIVVQITTDDFIESFSAGKQNYFVQQDGIITDLVHSRDFSAGVITELPGEPPRLVSMFKVIYNERLGQIKARGRAAGAAPEFDPDLAREQLDLLVESCGDTPLILLLLPYAPNIVTEEVTLREPAYDQLLELTSAYPGVTVVDPYPAFVEMTQNGNLPRGFFNSAIPGAGHLNIAGNEVVGRLLAKAILEALP